MKAYLVAFKVLSDMMLPLYTGHQIVNAKNVQEAKERVSHHVAKRPEVGYIKILNVNS